MLIHQNPFSSHAKEDGLYLIILPTDPLPAVAKQANWTVQLSVSFAPPVVLSHLINIFKNIVLLPNHMPVFFFFLWYFFVFFFLLCHRQWSCGGKMLPPFGEGVAQIALCPENKCMGAKWYVYVRPCQYSSTQLILLLLKDFLLSKGRKAN